MNIALVFNLRRKPFSSYDEAEYDSKETVEVLKKTIESLRHEVLPVEADDNFYSRIKKLKNKIDLVFNIAEGKFGEGREAYVPAILDALQIPYTGSGPLTLALALDKGMTKAALACFGIPTARFQMISRTKEKLSPHLKFPLFVKPNSEGSSKGVSEESMVKKKEELFKKIDSIIKSYHQTALVEEYLPGPEFSVAILGNYPKEKVLPIMKINFNSIPNQKLPIDTFVLKHCLKLKNDFIECPAEISKKLEKILKSLSLKIYRILRCKDLARIDFRLDKKGAPNFIEINPLPNISFDLLCGYTRASSEAGFHYKIMIRKIIETACRRYKFKK